MRTPFKGHHVPITRRSALVASAAVGASRRTPGLRRSGGYDGAAERRSHGYQAVRAVTSVYRVAPCAAALPDGKTRNIVSRFTSGVNAERLADVAAEGGVDAWFEHQLAPGNIPDIEADATWGWFPVLAMTPGQTVRPVQGGDSDRRGDDAGPRLLDHAAPVAQQARRRGADGRLLVQPAARRVTGEQRLAVADRVRAADPQPRSRRLRRPAQGRHPTPRDGPLPQQRPVDRRRDQREPRPRASRVPHGGSRATTPSTTSSNSARILTGFHVDQKVSLGPPYLLRRTTGWAA